MLVDHHRNHGLDLQRLRAFLATARRALPLRGRVGVCLTRDAEIQQLNRRYRDHDMPTDVLSFAAGETEEGDYAGDLVVSLDTAARQARRLGHSLQTEVRILLLHGLLHLSGMDHERDGGEMRAHELALRRRLRLPTGTSLLERQAHAPRHAASVKPARPRARAADVRKRRAGSRP